MFSYKKGNNQTPVSKSHRATRTHTDPDPCTAPLRRGLRATPGRVDPIRKNPDRDARGFFLVGSARQPPARRAGLSGAVGVYPWPA